MNLVVPVSEKSSERKNNYRLKLKSLISHSFRHGIISLILFTALSSKAQEISYSQVSDYNSRFNRTIGVDENLINGYQYINQYPKARGHAFLDNDEFVSGQLIINNKFYNNIFIKYDILNQDIVLRYKNSVGSINHLVLQKSFINAFEIKGKYFRKMHFPETGTQFFQVVSSNEIMCLYLWKKSLTVSSSSTRSYYNFSDQRKTRYLVNNNELRHYKSKKSFISFFPDGEQAEIKKYIKKHKINIRTAPDGEIRKLIEYYESTVTEGRVL